MEAQEKVYKLSKLGLVRLTKFVSDNCRRGVASDFFVWEPELRWEGNRCFLEIRGEYSFDKKPKTCSFEGNEVEEDLENEAF